MCGSCLTTASRRLQFPKYVMSGEREPVMLNSYAELVLAVLLLSRSELRMSLVLSNFSVFSEKSSSSQIELLIFD